MKAANDSAFGKDVLTPIQKAETQLKELHVQKKKALKRYATLRALIRQLRGNFDPSLN